MPGRIELRDAAGTFAVLLATSGAGVATMEEAVEWATGAAIFSAGKTFGRREVTIAGLLSGRAATELVADPPATSPDF
jgi:hypothetical protein